MFNWKERYEVIHVVMAQKKNIMTLVQMQLILSIKFKYKTVRLLIMQYQGIYSLFPKMFGAMHLIYYKNRLIATKID